MIYWNDDEDDRQYIDETVAKGREIFRRDLAAGTLKCVETTIDYEAQRKNWFSTQWAPRSRSFIDCNYGDDETAIKKEILFNRYGDDDIARNIRIKSIPFKNKDYNKFFNTPTTSEKEYIYMRLARNEERK